MASSNGGVPPGFRFHPTDEELLHYYLKKKISFQKFDLEVIREVDLNKLEPWDLQERCRIGSTPQNEWYFFSHKDRKYPTGSRTNRATNAGFWKATGRDKCIRNTFKKIGMRKTLVFYRGRAPHGQKTDWIMHEYRLEDNDDVQGNSSEDGWVVCRVFKKKNLFKLGNEGGTSMGMDHQLNNPTNNNQPPTLALRDTTQYLLRHHNHGNQQTFDLYKPDLTLNYSHIPLASPYSNIQPQYQGCETVSEVGTCEPSQHMVGVGVRDEGLNDWTMLDRIVTVSSHLGHEESSKGMRFRNANDASSVQIIHENASSVHQINQLSLRGEMDFWGYGK